MSKFFTAIAIGALPCLAGLVYPVFYRNDGKGYILFAAFAAGSTLAAGAQNISYSILYSWTDTKEDANIYSIAQGVLMQFAIFIFMRYCLATYYKALIEKISPPQLQDYSESTELLQDSKENQLAPSIFDGSTDLPGACVLMLSLAYVPVLVGFSIGISPFSHFPTLCAYTLHRIAGAVALSKALDTRGTPGLYSWMSLGSFSFAFPVGIILGSFFETSDASGFLVMQCALTAAILVYDVIADYLPKITKSAMLVFNTNGDFYVYGAFSFALIIFLVMATEAPRLNHETAVHLDEDGK